MTVSVENRSTLKKGRVFTIITECVRLPNGHTIEMDIIRHPGAAAIVALDAKNRVVLLDQYRHAIGSTLWEIPAGTFEEKETPLACARRELQEETGFSAKQWDYLGLTTPVPGYADEKIHCFLATDLIEKEQRLDPDEIVTVKRIPINEVVSMIAEGTIHDAKTVAALFLVLKKKGAIGEIV